jgi:hypothetical protein
MLKAFLMVILILVLLVRKAIKIFDKWGREAEEDLPWD